ncbi:U11/U12 small nuclear ribonucleoprotein 25 kDa protein isoform X2 [Rhodamnia argentea]|uniref:U11/U12 small nuclear ribonucleoprotein 25 kDa protein isoform X2 n=1 Tax=Rhodamnia argentea TaxID=178133 RepID=A0A8B8NTX3_9MYRT|nr:U11/U12 small nuclear ribonucleoprotein 25 kDa protein isoform X2 [Rhodamnia argentea]
MRRGVDFEETGSSLSCLGPRTIDEEFDDDGEEEGRVAVGCARSNSYYRLPQHLLKLSILKLDGSVFDVHVARHGKVAALKQAIEDVFSSSPKDGVGNISWSHVWGHFCLCFNGEKLLNDRAYLRSFNINDGDQLCFIRHLSTNYSPMKRQPKNQNVSFRQHQIT